MKNHARISDGGKRRKRRKGGMPSSLTPEVEKKILELLRKGISRRAAVGAAGASLSSFKRWMQRKDRRGRAFQKAVDVACSSARAEEHATSTAFWKARPRLSLRCIQRLNDEREAPAAPTAARREIPLRRSSRIFFSTSGVRLDGMPPLRRLRRLPPSEIRA